MSPQRTPLVVHVLPQDMARGAQVFAKALRDRLNGAGTRHRTLTLFRSPGGALHPDDELDLTSGRTRRAGLDVRAVLRLRAKLGDLAPDVIVAHGGEPLKYCSPARPPGAKLVYYKIGSSRNVARRRLRSRWHRRLIGSADKVVAISDDLAAEAQEGFGVRPERIVMIPNGRDPAHFRATDHDASPVQLAYIGQLEAPKRPLWFVEVVRRVAESYPGVRGVMVGDGVLVDEVRREASELPIEVLGRRDDVPALLAASHVLVSPSAREGMPGVFIEAGLSAVPVVTTDVAGASTVLDDGVTGHIVPNTDLDTLTERTLELVADRGSRRKLGEAARRRCLEHFSLDAVATLWDDVIRTKLPSMAEVTIFHNKNCSTSRHAKDVLEDRGVDAEVVDYLKTPLDEAQLTELIAKLEDPVADLVRKDGFFKERGLAADDYTTPEAVIALLVAHPRLMQRPIVVRGNRAIIGRPKDRVEPFVS